MRRGADARPPIGWKPVIDRAELWVHESIAATGVAPTLRQVFYRLVSELLIPNDTSAYQRLSSLTATARREGRFPSLSDGTRVVWQKPSYDNPADFRKRIGPIFGLDRTEGQEHQVWIGVEKRGHMQQMQQWVGERGWPIFPAGGYASQTIADEVTAGVLEDGRPAVLLYVGDYDASGRDIQRDLVRRTDVWTEVVRVALTAEQILANNLPLLPGKTLDPRAAGFAADHRGQLLQVEVDALGVVELRDALLEAAAPYWDEAAFDEVVEREESERERLWNGMSLVAYSVKYGAVLYSHRLGQRPEPETWAEEVQQHDGEPFTWGNAFRDTLDASDPESTHNYLTAVVRRGEWPTEVLEWEYTPPPPDRPRTVM